MSVIAKLVYSGLLLSLSGVMLRELWTVWFDTTIYIGRFDVVSDTGKDDSASAISPSGSWALRLSWRSSSMSTVARA
jgi:hypothetical protein